MLRWNCKIITIVLRCQWDGPPTVDDQVRLYWVWDVAGKIKSCWSHLMCLWWHCNLTAIFVWERNATNKFVVRQWWDIGTSIGGKTGAGSRPLWLYSDSTVGWMRLFPAKTTMLSWPSCLALGGDWTRHRYVGVATIVTVTSRFSNPLWRLTTFLPPLAMLGK
jgi:hypothetical protein